MEHVCEEPGCGLVEGITCGDRACADGTARLILERLSAHTRRAGRLDIELDADAESGAIDAEARAIASSLDTIERTEIRPREDDGWHIHLQHALHCARAAVLRARAAAQRDPHRAALFEKRAAREAAKARLLGVKDMRWDDRFNDWPVDRFAREAAEQMREASLALRSHSSVAPRAVREARRAAGTRPRSRRRRSSSRLTRAGPGDDDGLDGDSDHSHAAPAGLAA